MLTTVTQSFPFPGSIYAAYMNGVARSEKEGGGATLETDEVHVNYAHTDVP